MAKALAVIRTMFLVFIIIYTLVIAPGALWSSATATVSIDALRDLQRATWIAIAWIAFDTLVAWIAIAFRPHRRAPAPAGRKDDRDGQPPSPSPRT